MHVFFFQVFRRLRGVFGRHRLLRVGVMVSSLQLLYRLLAARLLSPFVAAMVGFWLLVFHLCLLYLLSSAICLFILNLRKQ
jgi:hypothetical protein